MVTETKTYHDLNNVTAYNSNCSAYSKSTGSGSASPRVPHPELSGTDLTLARKLPYHVGFTTIATRHEPNEPFGTGYDTDDPPVLGDCETLSQLDYCLSNPSVGRNLLHQDTKDLKITAIIRTGCNRGAQLVVVNDDMVAKVYDPLFYNPSEDCHFGEDVVATANSDYCHEAAAYHELQKSPAAQEVTPAFYGTWTINVDTLKREGDQLWKYTRQVPVILIEYVRGFTMTDINPQVLNEQLQSSVVKKALESESLIFHAGVNHGDMHPRNIIVVGFRSDLVHDAPKEVIVKVIDFNVAEVYLHPKCANADIKRSIMERMQAWSLKLPSPFMRFYHSLNGFVWEGWCPNDDPESDNQGSSLWLWNQFKCDERYIPVVWDPTHPWKRPKYVELENTSPVSSDSGIEVDMEEPKKREWIEAVEMTD
ncbi:hypothetical protein PTNB85_02689 [Pyrenophora teres f. teres]|nr:hypothetical protein PTNB85_02689 [Pyrenophora teres f. teres]